jgi:hypothetical protein
MLKGVLGEGYFTGTDGVRTVAAPGVVRGMVMGCVLPAIG